MTYYYYYKPSGEIESKSSGHASMSIKSTLPVLASTKDVKISEYCVDINTGSLVLRDTPDPTAPQR